MKVLITGAAGNLGGMLARHLLAQTSHSLNLMIRETPLAADVARAGRIFRCDLGRPETLAAAVEGVEAVVHFAGVLFAPRPEGFLRRTNCDYARNLIDASAAAAVKKFILVSFPHVEGPTSKENPCAGRQDRRPVSVHARTRLEAEKYLMSRAGEMTAVSLRPGMIYGRDLLMVDFARRLARRRVLAVWPEPTPIHLLSIDDFHACCRAAIENPRARGIYPLGDDAPTTLQEFLDACCRKWGVGRPWRVPAWSVNFVALACEGLAGALGTRTPFTLDFIRIGRVPYFCDTVRMKKDLLPKLKYPSLEKGAVLL